MSDIQHMLSEPELVWGTYPWDTPAKEPNLEDEWKAELVNMPYDKFVEFMLWVWSDAE